MTRRYQLSWNRFAQPDPWDGSYDLGDPQSLNRYAYVQSDPVNFIDPTGMDPWGENPGFIPAWLNGWNRTTNPTESFINWVAFLTTELHNRGNDNPFLHFDGFAPFHFGQQPGVGHLGGALPQKTPAQKKQDYRDCVKKAGVAFKQGLDAIPNVFHDSLPSARAVGNILLLTGLRTTGTAVFVGSISASAAAPLVVSTVAIGYAGTWVGNVTANTFNNAAQRGTLLGDFLKARNKCKDLLN